LGRYSSLSDRIESLLRRERKFSTRPSLAGLGVSAFLLALLLGAGGLTPSWIAIAQTTGDSSQSEPSHAKDSHAHPPGFEVASVKIVPLSVLHKIDQARQGEIATFSPPGAEDFIVGTASLEQLIGFAFSVNTDLISGKQKLGSDSYDVAAKPWGDKGLTYEQVKPLLQRLIEQRFHLTYHYETKIVPGYALVIGKKGPKLRPRKVGSGFAYAMPTGIRAPGATMRALAVILGGDLRCPVVDETGLKGGYDISTNFAPPTMEIDSSYSSLPSIFTAVQRDLGLKLVSRKVPVHMMVIDHVDRVPSPN
jgi:uncharacterized protein (TIGR03435 family)